VGAGTLILISFSMSKSYVFPVYVVAVMAWRPTLSKRVTLCNGTAWRSGNTLDAYEQGAQFEFHPGHRLPRLTCRLAFLISHRQIVGRYLV
jgi:hypothetical protein